MSGECCEKCGADLSARPVERCERCISAELVRKVDFYQTCHIADCSALQVAHKNAGELRRELESLQARVRELEEAGRALIAEWDNDQADDEGHDFRATVAHLRAALERGT
jgi:hypothetical protein